MKFFYLTLSVILLAVSSSYAQNTYPYPSTGSVGIGTTSPARTLHVYGTGVRINGVTTPTAFFDVVDNGVQVALNKYSSAMTLLDLNAIPQDTVSSAMVRLFRSTKTSGAVAFQIFKGNSNNELQTSLSANGATSYINALTGNLGIGMTSPQYKLDVNGTIHAKQVLINLTGFFDYVFKDDYKLMPLKEVKAYIAQNQHLPEIPSEKEMIKNGLDVVGMNSLLVKKVEELTLYLIEKDEQIKSQEAKFKAQQEKLDELSLQVENLVKSNR